MGKLFVSRLFILISALIWGSSFVAQVVGMEHLGPLSFISVRYIIGTLSVFIMAFLIDMRRPSQSVSKKENAAIKKREWTDSVRGGIVCGTFLFAGSCLQQTGLQYTQAGKAAFITAMYIIIVPVIEMASGKRFGAKTWITSLSAVAGIYILSITDSLSINKGDIMVLAGTLFWALHIISCDKFSKGRDPIKLSAIQFAASAAIATTGALAFETVTLSAIRASIIPTAYAGIMCTGVAYTFQMIGQKNLSSVETSLLLTTETLFALISAILILGESLTLRESIGCTILFVSVVAAQIPDNTLKFFKFKK